MDPQEAAIRQVVRLGSRPEDIRHILLTHMHFDRCGGLPDLPRATAHVQQRELDAYRGVARHGTNLAYVRRPMAHRPAVVTYRVTGES